MGKGHGTKIQDTIFLLILDKFLVEVILIDVFANCTCEVAMQTAARSFHFVLISKMDIDF